MTRWERVSSRVRLVEVAEVELLVVSRCMDRRREADFVSKRAEASPPDLAATLATVDIGVLPTYVLRDSAVVMVGVVCTDNAKTRRQEPRHCRAHGSRRNRHWRRYNKVGYLNGHRGGTSDQMVDCG